jgi:hypothetical protein
MIVDRKHQLESHCRTLFEQVVDAQPPTQALQQLRANVQAQSSNMASEQQLLQAVGNSSQMVRQGLSHFQQAESLYQQALNINERAKVTNDMERYEERREFRDEVRGNEWGAENAEWNRENLERRERQLQAQRDSLINQANDEAMRAYQVISSAFSNFPMEARNRYPQLCVSIGQVAFPRVEGANFTSTLLTDAIFGNFGAAMNDYSSGCKIQNNMRIVQQCVSMTSQQHGLITAMESAVNANVQQLRSNLQGLEQSIASERSNIFNAARAAVMQQ